MDIEKLNSIAVAMVADNKGLLAADESTGTIAKRLASIDVANRRKTIAATTANCCSGPKDPASMLAAPSCMMKLFAKVPKTAPNWST